MAVWSGCPQTQTQHMNRKITSGDHCIYGELEKHINVFTGVSDSTGTHLHHFLNFFVLGGWGGGLET